MTALAASSCSRHFPQDAASAPRAERSLRILFLASAHNSLSQRVLVALTELGHRVVVEVVELGRGDRGGGRAPSARS